MTQQAEHVTNGTAIAPRVPAPSRIGQGTAVEQSRAVAEVEAAIVVALRHPRDIQRAVADMQRSCAQRSLAEKAFFRFSRGEGQISGPSVQLARELARCWGNFQSGLVELRRDDEYRQSEMLAFAWDVETNTRTSTTFIVPHLRDTRNGLRPLTDMRDIYENNANMGARRLREMIFDSLPGWFTEDAVAACYRTLEGGAADLPQRIEKCIAGFAGLGVQQSQLIRKLGSPVDKWTTHDLATLTVIYRSLERGESSKDEEFEPAQPMVTAADITSAPVTTPAAEPKSGDDEGAKADPGEPPESMRPQGAANLARLLAQVQLGTPDDVLAFLSWRTGREIKAIRDLAGAQVASITKYLQEAMTDAQGDGTEAGSLIWSRHKAEQDAAGEAG